MANESLTRQEELVDGKYHIGAVIGRTRRSTVYETQFSADDAAAAIRVHERSTDDWEETEDPIERWRMAMELSHPNLLKIFAVGSSTLNEVPITYAVMELGDESLEGVLATRSLTTGETRAIVASIASALQYLHEKGYAHSRLRPSKILAVGEQIRLSSDSVTVDDGALAAEDMKALGSLIVQVLTRKSADGGFPDELPEPFLDISRHCLDPDPAARWSARQVIERLAKPDIVRPLPAHQLHTYPLNVEKIPVPEVRTIASESREEAADEDDTTGSSFPKWIYAALLALVVFVLIAAALRKKDPAEPVSAAARVTPRNQPAAVPVPPPFSAARPSPPPISASSAADAGPRKADGWSVIAAAYASREPAEKRMQEMAKKWPRFHPSVFQARTGSTHFLVVLGQDLSEDEADALRKRAVAAGFPRDTYIKKVM